MLWFTSKLANSLYLLQTQDGYPIPYWQLYSSSIWNHITKIMKAVHYFQTIFSHLQSLWHHHNSFHICWTSKVNSLWCLKAHWIACHCTQSKAFSKSTKTRKSFFFFAPNFSCNCHTVIQKSHLQLKIKTILQISVLYIYPLCLWQPVMWTQLVWSVSLSTDFWFRDLNVRLAFFSPKLTQLPSFWGQ